jgi:hypothetical protein
MNPTKNLVDAEAGIVERLPLEDRRDGEIGLNKLYDWPAAATRIGEPRRQRLL